MKVKRLFAILFLYTLQLQAKEGMWLPFLLAKMNEKEMKSMGLKIKASDIYDVNKGSLKDAVVLFGSGCTGEVISDQGLVLTNHHCGYGTVQGLSSLKSNYLLQGFWAKNRSEEIPCPGLTVTFIVRIDDVSERVKAGLTAGMNATDRNKKILDNIAAIEKETEKSTGYTAQIKSFYYDNEYYLFLMEKFTDIRLAGFPPNGIGKFGGDTDNWAWPRHTGDFGLFRIYANKDNKPALFAKDNIPYRPKKSFTISLKGVQKNDFSMVYGFPGRTSEYLSSDGVAEVMNVLDPARIQLREAKLDIMQTDMAASEETFIKYASRQSSVANYYKKWKGELLGLRINNAIEKKRNEEAAFTRWVNAEPDRMSRYGRLLSDLAANYKQHEQPIKLNEYLNEAIWSSDLVKKGQILARMLSAVDTLKSLDSLIVYEKEMTAFYKSINLQTDYKITKRLYEMYGQHISQDEFLSPESVDAIYKESFISSPERFSKLIQVDNKDDIKILIQRDPVYNTFHYYDSVQKANLIILRQSLLQLNELYGQYMLALREYNTTKQFYPDANSTLRLTYGKIEGVKPQDGMTYDFYTTLDGAVRKNNPDKEEFKMPARLLQLHQTKNYGPYAIMVNGVTTVPLAFLASNHTTGGNSGSPVLNAKGELIGTNFDRIWEGTMSDILFDPELCRNITLDIRYTLFIIEKFGEAKWLVDEMKIAR
ncbi:MAG: S46 family peptidase [Chitinophagaceae bacterium]|nr:S46 family peptidase [Chitinophagaceae bacterium]